MDLLVAQLDGLKVVNTSAHESVAHSNRIVAVVLVGLGLALVHKHRFDEEVVCGDIVVVDQEVVFPGYLVSLLDYKIEAAIFVQIDEGDQIGVIPCQLHYLLVVL